MEERDARSFESKANVSFRWTAFSEILSKLIVPIMNMVLARLVAPSIFGIVATITIVTSFAQNLTEGGFAKYLLQHEFSDKLEFKKAAGTSLLSTFVFSILLVIVIVFARAPLASLIGAEGYETELIVASLGIPLYGVASIQISILRRTFGFKHLAFVRILSSVLTFAVEIGLAFFGLGIWGLIAGSIAGSFSQVILLLVFSKGKLPICFSWTSFRSSISSSALYMIEVLLTWLNTSLDVFMLTKAFSSSITGIYKNAFSTEKGIIAAVTAVFTPVLLSLLSRLANDDVKFEETVLKYQKAISIILIPMCFGMYIYQIRITNIFFGSGWDGAEVVIGAFALADSIKVPISDILSDVFISKGKPQYSIFAQISYCLCIILCCVFAEQMGFLVFTIARASCSLVLVITSCLFSRRCQVSSTKLFLNIGYPFLCSIFMVVFAAVLQRFGNTFIWDIASIAACILFYFLIYYVVDLHGFRVFVGVLKNRMETSPGKKNNPQPVAHVALKNQRMHWVEVLGSDGMSPLLVLTSNVEFKSSEGALFSALSLDPSSPYFDHLQICNQVESVSATKGGKLSLVSFLSPGLIHLEAVYPDCKHVSSPIAPFSNDLASPKEAIQKVILTALSESPLYLLIDWNLAPNRKHRQMINCILAAIPNLPPVVSLLSSNTAKPIKVISPDLISI
jgi:O-antigen/teichoic acid export membrane protein